MHFSCSPPNHPRSAFSAMLAGKAAGGKDEASRSSSRIAHKAQVEKDKQDAEDLVASKEAAEELEQQLAAKKAEALAQLESGAKAAGAEEETVQEAPDKQRTEMEGLCQALRNPDLRKKLEALAKWSKEASRLSLLTRDASEAASRLLNAEARKLYEARVERERSAAEAASPKPAQRKPRRAATPKRAGRKGVAEEEPPESPASGEIAVLLAECDASSMEEGMAKAQLRRRLDVACYTPNQLKQMLAEVGCTAYLHVCTHVVRAAKGTGSPPALDGTSGSRFLSTDIEEMIGHLDGEEKPASAGGSRAELEGLPCSQALFSSVEPSVRVGELVRQGIELIGCKGSEDPEMAAELFEHALVQLGLQPEQLRPAAAGARAARSHLLAIRGGSLPSSGAGGNTEAPSNGVSSSDKGETSEMMDMLGQCLGKTPPDGKAAMHEETAHIRMARVAADGGARETLALLATDSVLRSEGQLAQQLTRAQMAHSTLKELLHQSNLNKMPTGAIRVRGVLIGVADMRVVASQAQKVQAMAYKALAPRIQTMCPPSLVANGAVSAMLESVWFQQLGGAASTSSFKLQSLVKDGMSVPSLQGKKLSPEASMRMLISGMPAIAAAQGVSNPDDTTAQQVAARLTTLAGYNPQRVQHGTQMIIAPFLGQLERLQQTFEQGNGDLPTFQDAWEVVCATPAVKKYIENYDEADITGDESPGMMQQRMEAMEKQLKAALEATAKAQRDVSGLKQRGQVTEPKPDGKPTTKPGAKLATLTAKSSLSDDEWAALSKEEKRELKQARKAFAEERKASREAGKEEAAEEEE